MLNAQIVSALSVIISMQRLLVQILLPCLVMVVKTVTGIVNFPLHGVIRARDLHGHVEAIVGFFGKVLCVNPLAFQPG